ncbi:hypothetical protein HY439_00375 [Candidatus Microgenomates bacterium]|nr:hypothetical protein [Candidatus Microgenomates bacterium]
MPVVELNKFGKHARRDGKEGYEDRIPTEMRFVETDGTDVRVERVVFYDPLGRVEKVFMGDRMGVLFADMPDIKNDVHYLKQLESNMGDN